MFRNAADAMKRNSIFVPAALLSALLMSGAAQAEVIEIIRAADTELSLGVVGTGDITQLARQGASSNASDPAAVRVAARDFRLDPNAPGFAVAAAQVLPPDLTMANPAEFACNITLNSIDPNTFYIGRSFVDEERRIAIRPDEVNAASGTPVKLVGSLFIDGSFGMLRFDGERDLEGMAIKVRYEVLQQTDGNEVLLLEATLDLIGTSDGDMLVEGAGAFPTSTVVRSDFDDPFGDVIFQAAAFPRQALLFEYDAVVDEPLTLRVRAEIVAEATPGETTVTAALGAPDGSLVDVLTVSRPGSDVLRFSRLMDDAREAANTANETPTFDDELTPPLALPGCGLFGLEGLLALGLAPFLSRAGRRRHRGAIEPLGR